MSATISKKVYEPKRKMRTRNAIASVTISMQIMKRLPNDINRRHHRQNLPVGKRANNMDTIIAVEQPAGVKETRIRR